MAADAFVVIFTAQYCIDCERAFSTRLFASNRVPMHFDVVGSLNIVNVWGCHRAVLGDGLRRLEMLIAQVFGETIAPSGVGGFLDEQLFNRVSGGDPCVEPSIKRTHVDETTIHQEFCHLGRRGSVGTGAIQDDFSVPLEIVEMQV